ncbi:intracellular sulfur oxidation DsrE/DsrF family protein [Bradyrhizobium sp. USDA 4341]
MKIRIGEGRVPWEDKCSSATNRKRRIAVLVLVVLVLTNNPLLNNATNVAQCYSDLGEKVRIEVVTLGAGLQSGSWASRRG